MKEIVETDECLEFRAELNAALPPFLLSLVLNACSYGTGLILFPPA